jgi:hypothetical protein
MNLKNIIRRVRSLVREPQENFIRDEEIRDWANDASFEITKEIHYPWKEQTIYCVADQVDYDLASDFHAEHPLLDFYLNKQKMDKYDVQWMEREYPDFLKADSVTQPDTYYFRNIDQISIYRPPQLVASGTDTTGSGAAVLNDSAAEFASSYVGHAIQNTTDGSQGLITAVATENQLTAALTGGTLNVWSLADAYTINLSGTFPYTYKETDMTDDDDETLIAAKFPYLILYRILPMAEIKCYRLESSSKEQNRALRWESLYNTEFVKAKNTVNRMIRGQHGRSIPPGEWGGWYYGRKR